MADNKFSRSQSLMASCVPMTILQSIIGGKWKILILWYISVYKVQRFGELQRRIGNEITKSTLTKQLRELEHDGWINRQIYQEIPPKVEYTLTELAESFVPVLEQMKEWSETHCKASWSFAEIQATAGVDKVRSFHSRRADSRSNIFAS